MTSPFRRPEAFRPPYRGYKLLPFQFIALDATREVLVNVAGEHVVAPKGTARNLADGLLDPESPLFRALRVRHFLHEHGTSPLLDALTAKVRTKRIGLKQFTRLHIFVVTLRCEHSCVYCQVSRQTPDRIQFDMSEAVALAALDLAFGSPAEQLTIEFQGGESSLNFPLVRWIAQRARERAAQEGRGLTLVMATNLLLLDDDQLSACRDLEIHLSTSLDGPAFLHNLNRPRPGRDSHARLEDAIGRARRYVGEARIAALMTTSRVSLNHPVEIVDEYVRLGFRSIFIRPISPYGFATRSPQKSTYPMDEFLGFYGAALARILEHNRAGTLLSEAYARLLLTKILTPFDSGYVDLQSPAGAGVAVAVYNYDGDVYASDEGRMLAEEGDRRFRLGKVGDGYSALFGGDTLRRIAAASVVESLPGCELCAFRPYCGADPVYHYATQGDLILHQPTSGFCRKNMGILRHLFTLLEAPDSDLERIFFSWLRGSVGERS